MKKTLVIVIPFLSFKGITHVYLMEISLTHNKKQMLLLNVLFKCIAARPVPQILSIKDNALCNSSINYLFCMISFLIAPPTVFLSKSL